MMASVLAGTSAGLRQFDLSSGKTPVVEIPPAAAQHELASHEVRALAPEAWARIWAVVGKDDIWRVDRNGTGPGGSWERVTSIAAVAGARDLAVTCLADTRANEEGGILVGTSEAHLVRVSKDGQGEVINGFEAAAGRAGWHTPWGGPPDTRSISEDGSAVYVNVHVGGVLRSRDEGKSWEPTIDINADVHRVATGAGRVYAAAAGGLWSSSDQGSSWRLSTEGLHATYCRSVAICGDTLLVSASDGPHGGEAALYRSGPDAERFERLHSGLPTFAGNLDSYCVDALPNGSLAAFASEEGGLYTSTDQGSSWETLATDLGTVHCVLVLP